MNAEQWAESDWDWGGEHQVVAIKRIASAIAAAGIDTDTAIERISGEATREAGELRQTSGELCPRCGWRMVLPGDGCMKCECERLRGELRRIKGEAKADAVPPEIAEIARKALDGSASNTSRWKLSWWASENNPPAAIAQAAASWRATKNETSIKCVAQWVLSLGTPKSTAAPPDPERERRRWELYRDLVVQEHGAVKAAAKLADAALAAYYGEQHGSSEDQAGDGRRGSSR